MITIWLIICLKAHNNLGIMAYLHARKHCASLARTAVELYDDPDQEGPSKSLLRLSLAYWERRIRETYAYSKTAGYVLWDQIRWWKAIPSLPNLFQDKEDTLQNHLLRLWEEEDLTATTNYCLKLGLEAGKSPLARYEAPEYTLSRSRRMLGSMDPLLLAACVRGTVASLAETEGSLVRKELLVIAARDDVSPGTYANFFTDHSGPFRNGPHPCSTTTCGAKHATLPGSQSVHSRLELGLENRPDALSEEGLDAITRGPRAAQVHRMEGPRCK